MRIHPEGIPVIMGAGLLTLLSYIVNQHLGNVMLLLSAFVVYFFRNPKRITPDDAKAIVSPADGVIIDVSEDTAPGGEESLKRVSIFLRIWDVHVIRIPFEGKIAKKVHKRGT